MNKMYNIVRKRGGTYLVTSRYEGGPQAIIEAAQTKTKILSTDVGIASSILHPDCICKSVEEIVEKLKADTASATVNYNYDSVQAYTIDKIVPMYDDFLEGLV